MIPRAAAESQSERRRPDRAWTRREYKGRKKPLHRLLIVTIATVALIVVGGIVAPSTVSVSALQLMLPFFAVLAVASIGQHLVIQQRGLDLSVAGIMSFSAVIVSALPSSEAGVPETLAFVALALAMGLGVGAVNGALVALLRVNSLVTTIGMNSLMLGITMYVTSGFSQQAPPPLNRFGVGKFLEVPLTLYVMIVIAAIAIFVLEKTTVGRRFIATSVNPDAALAVGIPLDVISRCDLRACRLLLCSRRRAAGGLCAVADGIQRHALSAGDCRSRRGRRQSHRRRLARQCHRNHRGRAVPHLSRPARACGRLRDIGPEHRSGHHHHRQRRHCRSGPAHSLRMDPLQILGHLA